MARTNTTNQAASSRSGTSKSTAGATSKSSGVGKTSKQTSKRPTTTSRSKTSRKQPRLPSSSNSEDVEDDESQGSHTETSEQLRDHSSEPDFILAEVTNNDDIASSEPAISLPLIHRIMQEYWQDKEKTKITADAREVVGKYVEVFVREAIMRCSFERKERDGLENGGVTNTSSSGWLEVEDLERIAPQLCLDF